MNFVDYTFHFYVEEEVVFLQVPQNTTRETFLDIEWNKVKLRGWSESLFEGLAKFHVSLYYMLGTVAGDSLYLTSERKQSL